MPTFKPSPNITYGATKASGSSHQFTGSVSISGSLTLNGSAVGGGGSGDVVGPGSSTDNAVARFDSTTGKLLQNSGVLIDDSNNVSVTDGAVTLSRPGSSQYQLLLSASNPDFLGIGNIYGAMLFGAGGFAAGASLASVNFGDERLQLVDKRPLGRIELSASKGIYISNELRVDAPSVSIYNDGFSTDGSAAVLKLSGSIDLEDGGGPRLFGYMVFGDVPDGEEEDPPGYIIANAEADNGDIITYLAIITSGSGDGMVGLDSIQLVASGPNGEGVVQISDRGVVFQATTTIVQGVDLDSGITEGVFTVRTTEDGDTMFHVSGANGNVFAAGAITASFFTGDGSALTNLPGGGGGSVAGSNQQVQFNQNSAFGANGDFTYNGSGSIALDGDSKIFVDDIQYNSTAQVWTLKDNENAFGSGPGTNGALLFYTGSGGGDYLKFNTSADTGSKGVVFPTAFFPGTNDAIDIGDSSFAFRNIYASGIGIAGDLTVDGTGAGDGGFVLEMPNNKNEGLMIRNSAGGIGNHITLGTTATPRINLSQPTVIGASETLSPKITLDVHYSGSGSPTNLGTNTGGGEVVYFGGPAAGGLINVGGVHYLKSDGDWAPVNANVTGSGHNQLLGIALGATASVDGMLIKGYYNVSGAVEYYIDDFIKGGPVYIWPDSDPASGKVTGSAPTGSDEFVRVIGYGTDTANVIYFNPDATYIELA